MKKAAFGMPVCMPVLCFTAVCLTAVCLSGCASAGKKETQPADTSAVQSTAAETTAAPVTTAAATSAAGKESSAAVQETAAGGRLKEGGLIQSYLTGEMKDPAVADRRPIAVMMSNDKAALPQYGINRAGVVYEAPVEGIMNRYMAILEDYDDLARIGSCRSVRTYYTYFAHEWDAVCVHYGQSTFAKPYLKNNDDINGVSEEGYYAFYRSRDKRSPHNAYTSGEKLKDAIAKFGFRQTYDPAYTGHFKFAKPDVQAVPENALPAANVFPGYTYNKPQFEYHADDGLYYRYQYGAPHLGDEGQIAVKNLILQYAPVGHYATTDYLNINTQGDSYGYFITDGVAEPVKVVKNEEFDITRYYDDSGKEITLNTGKTWVCILDSSKFQDTVILGPDGNQTN